MSQTLADLSHRIVNCKIKKNQFYHITNIKTHASFTDMIFKPYEIVVVCVRMGGLLIIVPYIL